MAMKLIVLLISFLSTSIIYSQDAELKNLLEELPKAKTDLDKISVNRQLMQYHNGYGLVDSAKYYLDKISSIADQSSDPTVKIEGMISNGLYWHEMKGSSRNEKFLKSQNYFKQALELARNSKDRIREGWAHYSLSFSWGNALGEKNKMLDEAEKALNIALENSDDSLYIYSYLRVAIAQRMIERNYEQAYMNLDKAMMKAIEIDNPIRLRSVYNEFRNLYVDLNDPVKESEYIDQMAAVTKKFYRVDWEIEDLLNRGFFIKRKALGMFNYNEMLSGNSRISPVNREEMEKSTDILMKALNLLKISRVGINWKNDRLLTPLFWNYFWMNEPKKIRELKEVDPVITSIWQKQMGAGVLLFKGAEFYLSGQFDSAFYYLDSCWRRRLLNSGRTDDGYKVYILTTAKVENSDSLISVMEKTKKIFSITGRNDEVQNILLCLDSLYRMKKDYRQAENYLLQYVNLKDSLDKSNTNKTIWSLQVNNAEKIVAKQKEKESQAIKRRYTLQYIGITISIVAVFILLALFGIYRVSPRTIRVLGFFSFLFFFEFIFLLFKKYLSPITHEEPIRELIFMIILAAILIPLHHFIEHEVIHYLTSTKMFKLSGVDWQKILKRKRIVAQKVNDA